MTKSVSSDVRLGTDSNNSKSRALIVSDRRLMRHNDDDAIVQSRAMNAIRSLLGTITRLQSGAKEIFKHRIDRNENES